MIPRTLAPPPTRNLLRAPAHCQACPTTVAKPCTCASRRGAATPGTDARQFTERAIALNSRNHV
eukprot:1397885-Alexandrium_andersonii.AAC.1